VQVGSLQKNNCQTAPISGLALGAVGHDFVLLWWNMYTQTTGVAIQVEEMEALYIV